MSSFLILQPKSSSSTCSSMPFSLDSSPLCCMCSTKHWTRINPNGSLKTAWSEPTLDSVSVQCPQSRMSRAHSCGSRQPTRRISITGQELWMNSWNVSWESSLARNFLLTAKTKNFSAYNKPSKEDEKNRVDCSNDQPPPNGKVCRVDVKKAFGQCTTENRFGYPKSSPCVFLKLNKVCDTWNGLWRQVLTFACFFSDLRMESDFL